MPHIKDAERAMKSLVGQTILGVLIDTGADQVIFTNSRSRVLIGIDDDGDFEMYIESLETND